MSKPCTLKHKKSIDNLREDLKEAGYTNNLAIGSDTSLRARKAHNEKIAEALPPIQAVINAWEKGLRQEGILREGESILEDKLVKPYPGDIDSRISFTRNILTVNIDESILKRLDDKRKSLGIYESKQSLSDYRKKQRENNKGEQVQTPETHLGVVQDLSGNTYSVNESDIITYETEFGPIRYIINENGDMVMLSDKNTDTVKEDVEEVFNKNPELANEVYEALGLIDETGFKETSEYEMSLGEAKFTGVEPFTEKEQAEIDRLNALQKATAQQLYSQYLEQNPNGNIEQFKNWIDNNQSDIQHQDSQYSPGINNENSLNSPIFEPQVKTVKLNC